MTNTNEIQKKIYIIVRPDLAPGLQAAQACHALREFVEKFPEIDREWFTTSNNIVVLNARSHGHLLRLAGLAVDHSIACAQFFEPDCDNELTAIALGPEGSKLVSQLPLALKAAA